MSLVFELQRSFFGKREELGEKLYLATLRLIWLVKHRDLRLLILRCLPTNAEYLYAVSACCRKAKFDAKYYGYGPKKRARLIKHRVKEAERNVYNMIAGQLSLLRPKIEKCNTLPDKDTVESAMFDFMMQLHKEFLEK